MVADQQELAAQLQDLGASLRFTKSGKILAADFREATEQVSDPTLQKLSQLTGLRELYLAGCNITDAALPYLEGLEKLATLDLQCTQVTDAGLAIIKRLPLQLLLLSNSQVTREGVQEVRKAMLKTRIVYV